MTELPRRRFLSLTGGAVVAGSLVGLDQPAGATSARNLAAAPPTIPALQSWTAGSGQFTLPEIIRLVIGSADAGQLQTTADVLAEDLRKVTRRNVTVVVDDQQVPATGDIVLRLAAIPGLNAEGYELVVGPSMMVRGSKSGVFFGTRTIVQWLRQATTIPAGTARDWPRYPERGLLVAHGAKSYTMTWWQGQIQELSYLKMNMLWLYVGYATTPMAEVQAIANYAARYNITIVPQVNMPGHMEPLLAARPDLALPGSPGNLDLSKPEAYTFAKDLITPLMPQFNTPWWHMGGDEYRPDYAQYPQLLNYARANYGPSAIPNDVVHGFMHQIHDTVAASGKRMRVWSDCLFAGGSTHPAAQLQPDIVIEHWVDLEGRRTVAQLAAAGHKLHNCNPDYVYYDPGPGNLIDPANIYDRFTAGKFRGREYLQVQALPDDHPALMGSKIHLWTLPDVESEEFQSNKLMAPLRSLAQILWGSPKPAATYAGFAPLITTIGRPPGFPVLRHRIDPLDGATSVAPTRVVKVQFFDDVDPSRIQLSVGTPEASIPGRVTYDAASKTATFTPNAPLLWSTIYPVTLMAWDTAGNGLPAPHHWSFRTATQPTTYYPRSIWPDTDAPAVDNASDSQPLELGVKFRVDVDGVVLGVRYYKGASSFGTHDGNLWAANGSKLASATFTGESTVGWQEVRFASPVRVRANTTYVASYTSEGKYAGTNDVFTAAGKDNGVLHALRSGVDGGNGVFRYGKGFPTESYRASSYWVDVVFQPDTLSIWDVTDVPVSPNATEGRTLELGVKFQAEVPGSVLGIRYYKGQNNTGTHVGTLWAANGSKLASAVFTGGSAVGWQEVRFASPVRIDPGVTYVASYNAPNGVYAGSNDVFTTSGKDNGPLHALRSGLDGGNGVFAMAQGQFPTESYRASNYFADVVFTTQT